MSFSTLERGDTPDYELAHLRRLLEGTFDNYEQVYWEEVLGVDATLRHRRMTSVYRHVALPAFDGCVFYAHKWWDGDPAKMAYRNLYVVKRDPALDLLRLDLLAIPNPERLDTALYDDSVLRTLKPSELTSMPSECNTVWRREGEAFRVTMAGDCRLTSVSPTGEPLAITVDTRVDATTFLYLSYGRDQHGALLYGPKDLVPSRELRARWFDVVVHTDRARQHFRLHDQGGSCEVDVGAGSLRLRLRQIQWPSSDRPPVLALIVMRDNEREVLLDTGGGPPPSVAFASPSATAIGLRVPGVEVVCETADTDRGTYQ